MSDKNHCIVGKDYKPAHWSHLMTVPIVKLNIFSNKCSILDGQFSFEIWSSCCKAACQTSVMITKMRTLVWANWYLIMIILKKNNSLVSNNNNSQKLEQDEFHTLTITFSM